MLLGDRRSGPIIRFRIFLYMQLASYAGHRNIIVFRSTGTYLTEYMLGRDFTSVSEESAALIFSAQGKPSVEKRNTAFLQTDDGNSKFWLKHFRRYVIC